MTGHMLFGRAARLMAATLVALAATAATLTAQSIPIADSLLRVGALAKAESVYYAAARTRPHDPIARWALGRYLAGRGAVRVGATLLEESLKFGGEPTIVGRDLAPVYATMGDYRSLSTLVAASPAEKARARWFIAHEPRVVAPESLLIAVYWQPTESDTLGRIPIRINGKTVEARVSAHVQGIVVSDTSVIARGVHRFEAPGAAGPRAVVLGAADSVAIGRMSLVNYPVTIGRQDEKQGATIGLDVLSRFAPTFDPKANRVTLRVGGSLTSAPVGDHFSTLYVGTDYRVARAGGWVSVMEPQIARMLRDRRWTVDAKRGQLIVEP